MPTPGLDTTLTGNPFHPTDPGDCVVCMEMAWYRHHRVLTRLLAVVVPIAVSAALALAVGWIPHSASALILVLLVVGAAATGDRLAGALAAVSSAVGFDLFLTQPYFQLRIEDPEEIELAVLLLLVGLAVSELAAWGLRQNSEASQQTAYLKGVLESADLAAGSADLDDGLERVAGTIRGLLCAEQVTYEHGAHDAFAAVIQPDGTLRYPLETGLSSLSRSRYSHIAIPVTQQGSEIGHFRVVAPQSDLRDPEMLRVAGLLAAQWSLRASADTPHRSGRSS